MRDWVCVLKIWGKVQEERKRMGTCSIWTGVVFSTDTETCKPRRHGDGQADGEKREKIKWSTRWEIGFFNLKVLKGGKSSVYREVWKENYKKTTNKKNKQINKEWHEATEWDGPLWGCCIVCKAWRGSGKLILLRGGGALSLSAHTPLLKLQIS